MAGLSARFIMCTKTTVDRFVDNSVSGNHYTKIIPLGFSKVDFTETVFLLCINCITWRVLIDDTKFYY